MVGAVVVAVVVVVVAAGLLVVGVDAVLFLLLQADSDQYANSHGRIQWHCSRCSFAGLAARDVGKAGDGQSLGTPAQNGAHAPHVLGEALPLPLGTGAFGRLSLLRHGGRSELR